MSPKKLVASLLIGAQLAVVTPSFAEPPVAAPVPTITVPAAPPPITGEKDSGAVISPMKKGQVAPYTGVLFSPTATASIIAQIAAIQDEVTVEVDHARADEQAKCKFQVAETTTHLTADKQVLQAQVDDQNKRIAALNESLKKSEASRPNLPLWVGLGTGGGLVVGVALSALTVYAIGKSTK